MCVVTMAAQPIVVVAAAIIQVRSGHSLLVSKKAAPEVFCLSGGKPEAGESAEQTLIRELGEELGAIPTDLMLLGDVEEVAPTCNVPMRMTVFTARIAQDPRSAAEPAVLGLDQRRRWLRPAAGCCGQRPSDAAAAPRWPTARMITRQRVPDCAGRWCRQVLLDPAGELAGAGPRQMCLERVLGDESLQDHEPGFVNRVAPGSGVRAAGLAGPAPRGRDEFAEDSPRPGA
jgi:ADP-ribose pyrophosphatase YjhB (NUDIX family)